MDSLYLMNNLNNVSDLNEMDNDIDFEDLEY